MVDPMVGFLHHQLIAMRATGMIDPCFGIQSRRLYYEGIIIDPFAHRIPVITWIRILRKCPSIGPDDAVIAVERTENNYLLGSLKQIDGPEFPKVHVWESQRIAFVCGIIGQRGVYLA